MRKRKHGDGSLDGASPLELHGELSGLVGCGWRTEVNPPIWMFIRGLKGDLSLTPEPSPASSWGCLCSPNAEWILGCWRPLSCLSCLHPYNAAAGAAFVFRASMSVWYHCCGGVLGGMARQAGDREQTQSHLRRSRCCWSQDRWESTAQTVLRDPNTPTEITHTNTHKCWDFS